MKLEFYSSLSDKEDVFDCSTSIESKSELDSLINDWKSKKSFIFRGVNEAKYKLYNSAQRIWATEELFKHGKTFSDFITDQVTYAKSFYDCLLEKFYLEFGSPLIDIHILSFLQHYGQSTVLLDFSYNFKKSMFFAVDSIQINPANENSIDNYFSVYAIDTGDKNFNSLMEILAENGILDNLFNQRESFPLNYFMERSPFYFPWDFESDFYPLYLVKHDITKKKLYLVNDQHNLRIITQEGLFVFNPDDTKPLEKMLPNKIKCWNIHKSLTEYLKDFLSKEIPPITSDFIYPNEEQIAKMAQQEFKKKI